MCRWVDQLLQAASKQAAAVQSPNGIGTDGHLLAPSPSGMGPALSAVQKSSKPALRPQDYGIGVLPHPNPDGVLHSEAVCCVSQAAHQGRVLS